MPANTQITAALVQSGEVPPDQNCLSDVNALLPVIAAYMGVATVDPESPQSQTNSVADQALNTANNAISQVNALQALIPARRTSGSNLVPITTVGDSSGTAGFSPDMPNANYQVNFTMHGPSSAATAPQIIVVTRTISNFEYRVVNTPGTGTWSFSYEAVAL